MRNVNDVILSKSDATSQQSSAIPAGQIYVVSAQAVWSDASAAGNVKLQGSNDVPPAGQLSTFTPTNWSDIPSTTQTITAGIQLALIPATQISYQWIRAVWTQTTPGVGTITVSMNAQGF